MHVYLIFDVSLLEPISTNPFRDQAPPLPPPVITIEQEESNVLEILDCRKYYRCLQYLAKWVEYYHLT
jgi:hypothetical protein